MSKIDCSIDELPVSVTIAAFIFGCLKIAAVVYALIQMHSVAVSLAEIAKRLAS